MEFDVLFLALAQNCADTIPGTVRVLKELCQSGIRVMAVIGENGSNDGSRQLLEQAATQTGLVTVMDTSSMSKVSGRLERMAHGRQMLAEYVREMTAKTRAVCVLDVDEPFLELLDHEALKDALRRLDDDSLFAVAATSRPTYYDLLAFEDEYRTFSNLENKIKYLRRHPMRYYAFFRDVIYREQRALTSDSDIFCISAFNGLCLYTAKCYAVGSYLPLPGSAGICEHVLFNRSIAKATRRRMVISPTLIVPMPKEHGRRSFPGFVWQRVKKLSPRALFTIGFGGS